VCPTVQIVLQLICQLIKQWYQRCWMKTGTMCPQEDDKLYNWDVIWTFKKFKQCHKMTDNRQKTFSLNCLVSWRKSHSPSHVIAILPAINEKDATFLACGDALISPCHCWQQCVSCYLKLSCFLLKLSHFLLASGHCFSLSVVWQCQIFALLFDLFAVHSCALLLPSDIRLLCHPLGHLTTSCLPHNLLLSCLLHASVSQLFLLHFCLAYLLLSDTLLPLFSHWIIAFSSWSSGNIVFATLLLSCLLPSIVGELTIPLMLLFDLFATVLHSLTSFSHWVIASSYQLSGNWPCSCSLTCLLLTLVTQLYLL